MPAAQTKSFVPARINLRRFGEYKNIFGAGKMRFLWNEYLAQSSRNWRDMAGQDWDSRRLAFHSWRSSSQVFGMDEFSRICLVIEERILSRRLDGLEPIVADSRRLYDQSINEVTAIFLQMEQENDKTGNQC